MLLGTRSLNTAPLATSTYKGVTYTVDFTLDVSWGSGSFVEAPFSFSWAIASYVETALNSSWDIQSYVVKDLSVTWDIQSALEYSLDITWGIAYQEEVTTSNRYCMAPVNRTKNVDCLINNCEGK